MTGIISEGGREKRIRRIVEEGVMVIDSDKREGKGVTESESCIFTYLGSQHTNEK